MPSNAYHAALAEVAAMRTIETNADMFAVLAEAPTRRAIMIKSDWLGVIEHEPGDMFEDRRMIAIVDFPGAFREYRCEPGLVYLPEVDALVLLQHPAARGVVGTA